MYSLKITTSASNINSPTRVVGNIMKNTTVFVNKAINNTDRRFQSMVSRELTWHSWRGGVKGSLGTLNTKSQRISTSKKNGYLSTGVPYYVKQVGKYNISFGFGDRKKILNLRTRDGKHNLVDLLEYGTSKKNYSIMPTGKRKALTWMNNRGKLFIRKAVYNHPGVDAHYFYRRILLYLNEQVGLVSVGIRNNFTGYVREVSSGRIIGNLPAVLMKLDGRT